MESGIGISKRATAGVAAPVGRNQPISAATARSTTSAAAAIAHGLVIDSAACRRSRVVRGVGVRRAEVRVGERRGEIGGGREPIRRNLRERHHRRGFDVRGHRSTQRGHRLRLDGHHLRDDRLSGRAGERRLAGEHLVQHAPERIDVGARVDGALAHGLLGTHVLRRAERRPALGHARRLVGARGGEGDAEVRDERLALVQENVFRLDVAMNHAAPVRVVERAGDVGRDLHGVGNGQLPFAREPLAQRLAVDERHDVEHGALDLPGVDEPKDVRMLQLRRRLDLGQESLGADGHRELRPQHLDGDGTVVPDVARQIDRRHAAGPDLPLDVIAIGERPVQPRNRVRGLTDVCHARCLHERRGER